MEFMNVVYQAEVIFQEVRSIARMQLFQLIFEVLSNLSYCSTVDIFSPFNVILFFFQRRKLSNLAQISYQQVLNLFILMGLLL